MARKLTDPFISNHPNPDKRIEIYDELANGLALRVTPKGHKSFVFRFRFGHKVKRYTIGSYPAVSLAKAREHAKELSYQVSSGTDPSEVKKKAKEPRQEYLFSELTDRYEKRHLLDLRQTTRDEYQRIINVELKPLLGNKPVNEITRKIIIDILDTIAIDRKAPVQSNRVRAVLSSIYSFGIDKAILETNPVLTINRKKKTLNGEKVEKRRDRIYSIEEIKALWKAFSVQPEPAGSLFRMLLLCGQRLGETRQMKWEHIDFENQLWIIPKELTKANREQILPLSSHAFDIINKLHSSSRRSDFVFPNRRHIDKPFEWVQSAVYRIREQAIVDEEKGIFVKDFRVHDLRRTATTYMAELGTERTVLGKLLNHKGLAGDNLVTAIYDRHDYLDEKKKALQNWANKLEHIIKDE